MNANDDSVDITTEDEDRDEEAAAPINAFLLTKREDADGSWRLYGTPTLDAISEAHSRNPELVSQQDILFVEFNTSARLLRFHPIVTSPFSHRFLEPKHRGILTITMERVWHFEFREDPHWRFENIPTGFHRGAAEGFGVLAKNAEILRAVEQLGVNDLGHELITG